MNSRLANSSLAKDQNVKSAWALIPTLLPKGEGQSVGHDVVRTKSDCKETNVFGIMAAGDSRENVC